MQALVSHRNAFFMWKDYKRFILSESAAEELFSLVLKVIPKTLFETFTFTFCSLVLKYTKVISKTFFETFTFTCFHNIIQNFQANFSWIVSIIKPDRRIWFRKQKWTFVQLSSLFSARLVRMRDQGKNICPNLLVSTFARK